MQHNKYIVNKGQTLNDIALETGISKEEIIQYHNLHCSENDYVIVTELRDVNKEIYLPLQTKSTFDDSGEMPHNFHFDHEARYRCQQVNTSKIDGNTVHFVEQKFQYLLQQSLHERIGKVRLEEHLYNFSPAILNSSFEFISKTEFIKNNVVFNISSKNGSVERLINKPQIHAAWIKFRDVEFDNIEFIKKLQQTNVTAVRELKELGDKQFSPSYNLAEEEYRRNLFYFICFDKFLVEPIAQMTTVLFPFMSTIVPPVVVPIEFKYDKISEQHGILKIGKFGVLKLSPDLIEEIEKKYDEMHKPTIKYGFTEYKLEFTVKIEYNTKEKLVENADLYITEQIADNIENTCEFHLKRLQHFKP